MSDIERMEEKVEKDPRELSKSRILKIAKESPHDFPVFNIEELQDDDFKIEQDFHENKLNLEKLASRMQDYDKTLNESQKELGAYIINRMVEKFRITKND